MFAAAAALAACVSVCFAQEDRGLWYPASSNAVTVTGDVTVGEAKVTINFATFPLVKVRRLKPVEVSSVFDADVRAGIEGTLYKLQIPPNKTFLKRNTLCSDDATQWMATYASGRNLKVAFFSGDDPPEFTFDAMQKSSALCGVFVYAR